MSFKKIISKDFCLSLVNLTLAFWLPAFYLYSINIGDAILYAFLFLIFLLFFLANILLFLGKMIFKSYFKASLFISVCYLGLYSATNLYRQVYKLDSILSFFRFLNPIVFILLYFLLLFCLVFFIYKKHITQNIIKFFIYIFSFLFSFYLFSFYLSYQNTNDAISIWNKKNIGLKQEVLSQLDSLKNNLSDIDKRDIYFIIFDAHASIKDLKEYHNYDPDWFVQKLEDIGFLFTKNSKSNYCYTVYSLPSSLNMNYHFILNYKSKNSQFGLSSYLVENSNLQYLVSLFGYKFINTPSSWAVTRKWQREFSWKELFFGEFIQNFVYSFTSRQVLYPIFGYMRRIELFNQIDNLKRISKIKSPKVVFAHFLCPHFPFILKKDGSLELKDRNDNQAYIDQLDFFDQQIFKTIKFIISNSKTKPIIILQSDHSSHGYSLYPSIRNNFTKIDIQNLKFNILSAFYLPDIDKKDLPDDISPVNNFRFIFNKYFGTNFEILENKQIE